MIYEFTYTLDNLFEDLKKMTQREAITIPKLPKEQGYISDDVEVVPGIMEDKDKGQVEYNLSTAVTSTWEYIAAWVDELTVPVLPKANEGDPDVKGIHIKFKKDEVTGNRVILVTNALQELIKCIYLADWYSIYVQRPDLANKYMSLSVAKGANLRSILIKNNASRPYRFY